MAWWRNFIHRWRRNDEAPHLRLGRWGEVRAADYLKARGYRIIGRRVRVGRRDELDLVAARDDLLVFVEVKTRTSASGPRPALAVDRRKRRHLARAARTYLGRLPTRPPHYRFDIIEVIGSGPGEADSIRHLERAFPVAYR